jgi:hypothetical protein
VTTGWRVKLLVGLLLFSSHALWGGQEQAPTAEEGAQHLLRAVRVDTPPRIDGTLEKMWEVAPPATHFVQKQPEEGEAATEDSEVRVLYDDTNLYVGVMCRDSEPEKIIATEKRRDSSDIYQNDHFQMMLDTFHDRRNGYIFVTNPLGAKLDLQVRKEGKAEGGGHIANPNLNLAWDGVWKVRSSVHEEGWSAEIEIPLVTLKFHERAADGWGVNFLRNIRRKNEESTWAPLPRNLNMYKISLAGDLEGLDGLKKGLNLQIKPYMLGHRVSERDELGASLTENAGAVGLDLKYGLTSNLTLDVTVNTDFSQVEADDQQINLTRFSLFFPEKRDFFLEGAGLFNVGSPDDAMIFFSRRIGISEEGEEIPLLGGARVVGKAGRFNVGFINLQTQASGDTPTNNFTVVRLSRDILGKSAIGFMATNRQSDLPGDHNRAFSLDGDFIFGENLSVSGHFASTFSPDLHGENHAAKLHFQWRSDRLDIYGHLFDIQENFDAQMGFVKRTGIRRAQTHIGFTPEPDIPGVRRLNPHIYYAYTTDQDNNRLLEERHVDFAVDLIGGGYVGLQWNEDIEFVDVPFEIREDVTIPVGDYDSPWWMASFRSNRSRRLYTTMSYRWGDFYGGRSRITNLRAGLRPNSSFTGEFGFTLNDIALPQGDFTNHLLSARLSYSFSTRLALMSLVQWNSDVDRVDVNMRLNYIHRPGSDLFVVYNERREVEGLAAGILDRTLAVKFTYLFGL